MAAVSTLGGAASGSFIATFSCPLELVKIQQQLQHLLLTSSMATGGTIVRGSNANGQKFGIQRTDLAHKVGAGLPITTQAARSAVPPARPSILTNIVLPPTTSEKLATNVYGKVAPVVQDTPKQTVRPANGASTSSWSSAREIVRLKGVGGLWSGYSLHLCESSMR